MFRTVAVVSHTHWDREWYAPFETYRGRLVAMLDGAVDLLEGDPRFAHFHLDGQVAALDDYLELRPDQESRIRRLIGAGRLAVGPWYVLMDEFCVSAETMVRNLQLGLRRAAELGAEPRSGYLPDMFGHAAQMPQLLRQAGLGHAVVWRGVPAAVDAAAFWWEAPDGSRVRAEYLPVGYAGGAFMPKDPVALVDRIGAHEKEIAGYLRDGWPLLLMNGGDHQSPQAWVPNLLEKANAGQDRFRFEQTSLDDYLGRAPTEGLPSWAGELRSGHRAPLLMGVLSNRVDVKQAAAAAEQDLERLAEPLAALWLPPEMWPAGQIERAWLELVRNSAHDSVCACSVDAVTRAVLHRYDTARALSGEVIRAATDIVTVATCETGPVVVNPCARPRAGVIELQLPGTTPPPGTQQLEAAAEATVERRAKGRDLARVLATLTEEGWLAPAVDARLEPGPTIVIESDRSRRPDPAMAAVMAEAWAVAGARAGDELTVRVHRSAAQKVLARSGDVPGWGWAHWEAQPPAGPGVEVGAGGRVVDNGLVRVAVEPSGTFTLNGVPGQNRLVDEADAGDTYNFSPPPDEAPVCDPVDVSVTVVETGPVRAVIRVVRTYEWRDRSQAARPVEVASTLTIHAGEAAVRVVTELDHHHRDHRLRAHFPLPRPAGHSVAECAFATVERTAAEGGRLEPALATFPSRRFVTAGGLTVTHRGLLEYELVDDGTALALTLLRAVGVLARPAPAARPNIAGPAEPLRDAQLPGPQRFEYALAVDCPDPWALADDVWTPLPVVRSNGQGLLRSKGSRLRLEGAQVSALYRQEGALHVRVFNPAPAPATVRIAGHRGSLVDLTGRPVERWEECFELRPWGVATARLDAVSLD